MSESEFELATAYRAKKEAANFDALLNDLRDLLQALGMFDGARPESPHQVMQKAIAEVRLRVEDTKRLDWLEACIRDGSYASIFNDIVAVCQHAYTGFGPGPALRSTIDAVRPQERKDGKQ